MTGKLELPAGFRFHPTDEELVMHYLCRKCASQTISVPIIADINLYRHDPWNLPEMALYGEKEWYFFSPRDRKYPNGSRPNRAAGSGYWKATGADKPIGKPRTVGIKKALVFYSGKAPKGVKTNWIMHEYRLANVDRSAGKKNNSRLDDWVLCRIYNKKGSLEKPTSHNPTFESLSEEMDDQKPEVMSPPEYKMAPPMQSPVPWTALHGLNDFFTHEKSDSAPRIQHTDSSCSEQVLSPEKEVQSEPKWNDLENYQYNYMDSFNYDPFEFSPLQDMFMYMPKSLGTTD